MGFGDLDALLTWWIGLVSLKLWGSLQGSVTLSRLFYVVLPPGVATRQHTHSHEDTKTLNLVTKPLKPKLEVLQPQN